MIDLKNVSKRTLSRVLMQAVALPDEVGCIKQRSLFHWMMEKAAFLDDW